MNYTDENVLDKSRNLENAYSLIKQLKSEVNKDFSSIEEKMNSIMNQVSTILEETTEGEYINTENADTKEKRVLIISSKTQKVILPYTEEQIQKFIEYGKYKTREEVIENEYTVPLKKYKNEALSRVVEGYILARKKEGKSINESLKYAINLIFERRLHPAIITACNKIDELDIYLACLEDNVTGLFDFFDIVFEYSPLENVKIKDKEPYMVNE